MKPDGAIVSLYVDLAARVTVGDLIATPTGRRYLVLEVRVQQRGGNRGRQYLRCIVNGALEPAEGCRRHEIVWYKRGRARRRRR